MSGETRVLVAVLGLGANLGDRLASLRRAASALSTPEVAVVGCSGVFETPPAGGPPQPDYLNAAVTARTTLSPGELLEHALTVERALGRRRPDPVRFGARVIDIDILWLDSGAHQQPGLTVPHPRLTERPFALQPLVELIPEARDPRSGRLYATLDAARAAIDRIGDL